MEYEKSSITVHFNTTNNIYFKCKYLSHENAAFIYHNLLTSKKYCIGIMSLILLLTIGNRISGWVIPENTLIVDGFAAAAIILAILFGWTYMLSINLKVIELVIQTFDFWYKVFYSVCWMISYFVINFLNAANKDDRMAPLWRLIVLYIGWMTLCALFFFSDGLYLSMKIRRIVLIAVPLVGLSSSIQNYFTMRTIEWNPFEKYNFQDTTINFKTLIISSELNIALFLAKPVIADFLKYSREKIKVCHNQNKNNSNSKNNDLIVNSRSVNSKVGIRCTGVYKRPILEWDIPPSNGTVNNGTTNDATDHDVTGSSASPASVAKSANYKQKSIELLGAKDEIQLSVVPQKSNTMSYN